MINDTESVSNAVLQKSIPAKIRHSFFTLVIVDDFEGLLTFWNQLALFLRKSPRTRAEAKATLERAVISSHSMNLLIRFRKSTPPQNRQLNVLIGNSKQQVDDFVGELTF